MEKYDTTLLGILQNEEKVAPFLNVILGFLYRRTDFFRVMKADNDKLGFPPGIAKKLLMNIFTKYEKQAQKDATQLEEMKNSNEAKKGEEKESNTSKQDASVDCLGSDKHIQVKGSVCPPEPVPQIRPASVKELENLQDKEVMKPAISVKADEDNQPSNHGDDEEKEDPEQALQRRLLQANPLTYNGAECDNYFWSQTITETDLRVKIPSIIRRGKQVRVNIRKKHVHVSHQTEDGSWSTVLDNLLAWEINTEESMWTLTPGEFVHINLEKREERWWECVFFNEPRINTRKIDCSRPMTDLDDEAQAKIEEMMYNQRQKQLGLPQSHEQKTHDILRKAWDAEGSPFKGQPFDPSKLNVDANGVINVNKS